MYTTYSGNINRYFYFGIVATRVFNSAFRLKIHMIRAYNNIYVDCQMFFYFSP